MRTLFQVSIDILGALVKVTFLECYSNISIADKSFLLSKDPVGLTVTLWSDHSFSWYWPIRCRRCVYFRVLRRRLGHFWPFWPPSRKKTLHARLCQFSSKFQREKILHTSDHKCFRHRYAIAKISRYMTFWKSLQPFLRSKSYKTEQKASTNW